MSLPGKKFIFFFCSSSCEGNTWLEKKAAERKDAASHSFMSVIYAAKCEWEWCPPGTNAQRVSLYNIVLDSQNWPFLDDFPSLTKFFAQADDQSVFGNWYWTIHWYDYIMLYMEIRPR